MTIRMRFEAEAGGVVEEAIRDLVEAVGSLGYGAVMMLNGTHVWADPSDTYSDVRIRYLTMDEARRISRQRSTDLRDEAAANGKIENY